MTTKTMARARPGATARAAIERRRSGRAALNGVGVIGVGWGHPIGESVVRDLSANGARLSIALAFGVPDKFVLRIDGHATWRRCQVVRRAWCEVAVRFAA